MSHAVILTLLAGLAIPLGGLISSRFVLRRWCLRNELDHFMTAFGGGALLAAVALVLVPHGLAHADTGWGALAFLCGGLVFFLLDRTFDRKGGVASQFVAMLLDYIPESIALGAMMATRPSIALLLALMMGLQNLPEGFASYHEFEYKRVAVRRVWGLLCVAPLIGAMAAVAGVEFFSLWPTGLAALMLFCSGGILYLLFQDIAPQARLVRHFFPPLGAVFGFLLGMIGSGLLSD